MKKALKIFEVQKDLTSYAYPVIKIVVCILIILFSIFRNSFVQIHIEWINILIKYVCLVLTLCSILCLYISIGEIFHTFSNLKKTNCDFVSIKPVSINTVKEILKRNDIVEIEVCIDDEIIKIGSSADCKYSSKVFYDKSYYIQSSLFETINDVERELFNIFPSGTIYVVRIDGLSVDHYKNI